MGCVSCNGCGGDTCESRGFLRIGSRIPRRIIERVTTELSGASEPLVIGVNPVVSPHNMIPLIAKWYGIPVTVVASRPTSPYSDIVDILIESLGTSYINKVCRAVNIAEQY